MTTKRRAYGSKHWQRRIKPQKAKKGCAWAAVALAGLSAGAVAAAGHLVEVVS